VARTAALAGILVVVAACGMGPRAVRPLRETTSEELLASLAARRAAVTSLRARVRLRTGVARIWTRQAVLVQRPSAIRVDVLSPFGLALAMGTEGHTLWAFPPQQGVRYEGPASPANLARILGTPLAVEDLVDVFLGAAPSRTPAAPPLLDHDRDGWVLTIAYRGGTQTLRFTPDTHELASVEERGDGGAPVRVVFADYEDGFARALDLVAADGRTASIAYDQVERNAPIDPAAFAPPPAPRVLPLERAAQS
jgi:outer membrane lipoprotein-sorting protein